MSGNLTASTIKNANAKPDGRPHNITDGGGLYLHVTTTGKYWWYNYRYDGKMKPYPLVRTQKSACKPHGNATGRRGNCW